MIIINSSAPGTVYVYICSIKFCLRGCMHACMDYSYRIMIYSLYIRVYIVHVYIIISFSTLITTLYILHCMHTDSVHKIIYIYTVQSDFTIYKRPADSREQYTTTEQRIGR